jgi:ABC-type sugar transport system permease subunit
MTSTSVGITRAYTAAAVSKKAREAIADWMMLLSGPILFGSLFLTWSHQFSPSFLAQYGGTAALQSVPHNPTAWQLYSATDVMLGLLAAALVGAALRGTRNARLALVIPLAVALVFTIHALSAPPTTGADIFNVVLGRYVADSPTSGAGEITALLALMIGSVGVLLSFTAD